MGDPVDSAFLAPRWAIRREGRRITVIDVLGGSEATLEGAVGTDLFDAPEAARRRLGALGALDPTVRAFGDAFAVGTLRPWDRASLMRGGGYEQLFLELTARCNERCLHCYAESAPDRTETLPERTVLEVLDAAARLGFRAVQLTGGDPLVADTCLLAAEHARALRFEAVEVYTNGVALRGATFDRLRALEVAFAFSFYSHRPEVHDAITRHPGSHTRTLEAIERALAAGLGVRVNLILLEANADDFEATVALLQARGVPRESIGHDRLRTVGRGHDAPAPPSEAVRRANARPQHGSSGPERPFGGRIAVLPDGSVVPCIFARDRILGNVHEASLDVILEAPVALAPPRALAPDASEALSRGLACVECRVRAHHLVPSDRLLTLGLARP